MKRHLKFWFSCAALLTSLAAGCAKYSCSCGTTPHGHLNYLPMGSGPSNCGDSECDLGNGIDR